MPIVTRVDRFSEPESKVCTMCGQEKPSDEFAIKDQQTGLRRTWCRDCGRWRDNQRYYEKTAAKREAKRTAPKPTEKRCSRCEEVKPLSDFHRQIGKLARSHCKACRAIEKAAYRAANRARINAQEADYRGRDRTLITARHDQWLEQHPDRARAIASASRQKHADRVRTYNSQYQRENKERYNAYWHARRARKRANGGSHTAAEWEQCKAYFDYHCLMCGRREPDVQLTKDHIVSINLGGSDDIENIQPLCQRCNSSKGDAIIDLRSDWE